MEDSLLVSDANRALYLHDLDAETLRFLGDSLEEYADIARVEETARGTAKLRHARSALLRLWADRFRTDANRLEDTNGQTKE